MIGFLWWQNTGESSWTVAEGRVSQFTGELHSRERLWLFLSCGISLDLQAFSVSHFCIHKVSGWKICSAGKKKNEPSGTEIGCLLLQNLSALNVEIEINIFIIVK